MFHLPSTKSTTIHLEGFDRPAHEPADLPEDAVLVRRATTADAARIRTLARLDDRRLTDGPFLVAEIGGEAIAALSMSTGQLVADPFRRTRDAEHLLRLRAEQVAQRERAITAATSSAALNPAHAS
jgi:hypothetical protein